MLASTPKIHVGAALPTSGPLPLERGVGALARELEDAGFHSIWVADHIVLPEAPEANYPFAADGRPTWRMDVPYLDAIVALAAIADATERVAIGTAVLVLPLRNPVELAKQAASIDVISRGRLRLGVGAGWLRQEFAALDTPFERRGARLEEWIALARSCWTGRPSEHRSERYQLPGGMLCLPQPVHGRIPILVGGHSRAALARAGRIGDGWLGQQSLPALDPETLRDEVAAVCEAASEAGRPADTLRFVLRIVDSAGRPDAVRDALPELQDVGFDEVIVNVDWHAGDVAGQLSLIGAAAATA
jgi:probable F420-dependent oxidoreductase